MAKMTDENDNLVEITDDDGNPIEKTAANGYINLGEDSPEQDWFERDDLPEPNNQIEISDNMPDAIATVKEDEWTETPGGFAKIDVDLDHDVIRGLVDVWARDNLNPASLEVYTEKKAMSDPQMAPVEALYDAVVNDIIIDALTLQIERAEAAKNEQTKDV